MKCPCKDCVCMAICRHKSYFKLVECYLLRPMYEGTPLDTNPLVAPHQPQKKALFQCLKPLRWKVDDRGWVLEKGGIEIESTM